MMIVSTFKQEATTVGNTYLSLAYFLCLGTWPDHLTVGTRIVTSMTQSVTSLPLTSP